MDILGRRARDASGVPPTIVDDDGPSYTPLGGHRALRETSAALTTPLERAITPGVELD